MDKQEFIKQIATYVQKYAPMYGIKVCSPVIAQAILESAWGTSNKAKYHNYFGLKYRANRVTCNSGYFEDGGFEQSSDGSYSQLPSSTAWYAFEDMEHGVEGYFQFINIDNYANLKGVTDPETYLTNIKADGYATSLDYVQNVMRVINENNLTKYDITEGADNMSNKVTLTIIPNNGFQGYNVTKRSVSPKYIVCHYVGATGSAPNNVSYFNGGNRGASADFFVNFDGIVYQYNPDLNKYNSWHCGGGRQTSYGGKFFGICTNSNSIGIEMCCHQDSSGAFYFDDATVQGCVLLVKHLMNKFNIPASNVIRHYDVTGKYCPGIDGWIPTIKPSLNESKWIEFKKQIGDSSATETVITYPTSSSTTYLKKGSTGTAVKELQTKLNTLGYGLSVDGDFGTMTYNAVVDFQKKHSLDADGIVGPATSAALDKAIADYTTTPTQESATSTETSSYEAVVTATELNVRKVAGGEIIGTLSNGTIVTITKESNGWGYVPFKGWISLKYVQKVKSATCSGNSVRVRAKAGLLGKVLGYANKGDAIKVLGQDGSWSNVVVNGLTGWMSSQYVK